MPIMVISGGSSGIGLSCVNKFLKNGYIVYNLDILNTTHPINSNNYKWLKTDVGSHKEIRESIKNILQEINKIDILILSAGRHLSANIEDSNDEQLNELINVNLKGAFWLIQETISNMKNNLAGNIITIGSDQASIAKYNSSIYGMTKAALLNLTKSVALDYAKYNIRANYIGAGTIDTPLYQKAIDLYSQKSGISLTVIENDEALAQPIGRIGRPEEVAELTYFLAQDSAKFITGALIPIDGGYTTR